MAISTSQNTQLSQAHSVHDRDKQELSLIQKFVQKAERISRFEKSKKITEKDKIFLFSQLALMLETGTPLNRSLSAMKTQSIPPFLEELSRISLRRLKKEKAFRRQ